MLRDVVDVLKGVLKRIGGVLGLAVRVVGVSVSSVWLVMAVGAGYEFSLCLGRSRYWR